MISLVRITVLASIISLSQMGVAIAEGQEKRETEGLFAGRLQDVATHIESVEGGWPEIRMKGTIKADSQLSAGEANILLSEYKTLEDLVVRLRTLYEEFQNEDLLTRSTEFDSICKISKLVGTASGSANCQFSIVLSGMAAFKVLETLVENPNSTERMEELIGRIPFTSFSVDTIASLLREDCGITNARQMVEGIGWSDLLIKVHVLEQHGYDPDVQTHPPEGLRADLLKRDVVSNIFSRMSSLDFIVNVYFRGVLEFFKRGGDASKILDQNNPAYRDYFESIMGEALGEICAGRPAADCFQVGDLHRALEPIRYDYLKRLILSDLE